MNHIVKIIISGPGARRTRRPRLVQLTTTILWAARLGRSRKRPTIVLKETYTDFYEFLPVPNLLLAAHANYGVGRRRRRRRRRHAAGAGERGAELSLFLCICVHVCVCVEGVQGGMCVCVCVCRGGRMRWCSGGVVS